MSEPTVPLVLRLPLQRHVIKQGKTNLSQDGINPAHVPYQWVNNPTLGEFCFTKEPKSLNNNFTFEPREGDFSGNNS